MRLPIPKFKVLLYAPGLPAAGVFASAHFEDSVLVVQGKGDWFAIQGDRVRLKTGGFDGRQWLLSWQTPSGVAAAMLQGEDAVQAFIKLAPPVIAEELKRAHLAHADRGAMFRNGFMLMGLFFLLSIGLFWFYADEIGDWAADQLSDEQKTLLVEQSFNQLRPTLKLIERGEVRDTVAYIGVRVTAGSRLRYVFHVADSPRADAVALPDGHIVVYTGMLRATRNAEELAAVLAHQASHIEKQHSLNNVMHVLGWRAVLAALLDETSSSVWQGLGERLDHLSYSEAMEREADSETVVMLRRARVSAEGLVPVFERLAALASSDSTSPESGFIASHPVSPERFEALRQQIVMQSPYRSRPLPIDWDHFRHAVANMAVN